MKPVLSDHGDGKASAWYPVQHYRFLLDDGRIFDVIGAVHDGSALRDEVLKLTKATRIEGVAVMPEEPPQPEPAPKRRPAKKRSVPRQ